MKRITISFWVLGLILYPVIISSQTSKSYRRFNANNISTIIWNDGRADVNGSSPSFFYPILSGITVSFASGFLWAGYLGGTSLRMGGSSYNTCLRPGRILPNGNQDQQLQSIYKTRKNYKTDGLIREAKDESLDVETIRKNYTYDEQNWPAELGAPYDDVNKDGKYTPGKDIPGVPGAYQTIWFIANNLDSTLSKTRFSSLPTGIEMQCTVWGYYDGKSADNMIFKKYLIVNKNNEKKDFKDFYITYWNDADIGGGSQDYCGCDTTLNLFYTYSADVTNTQYGNKPPATGICILQGPIIKTSSINDIAYSLEREYKGYKNLSLSVHYYEPPWEIDPLSDPDPDYYNNVKQWYKRVIGKIWNTGESYINPITKKATLFPLSGDPVTGTGWIDGIVKIGGDRRNGGACGPFNFAYGDTQEVVIAQIVAQGTSNLNSITRLKEAAKNARLIYQMLSPSVITSIKDNNSIPVGYSLSQNYPNPFNPSTTINYSIPVGNFPSGEGNGRGVSVTLKVFDLLGREVATLVNEENPPGNYEVKFSVETPGSSRTSLPSGIYFYALRAGNYTQTKKMIFLK